MTRAVDGDTIEARIGGRVEDVRLIGVDTPETVKPDTPVQCFGAARLALHQPDWSNGRRVRLVFGVERRDVYGRLLAYVYLGRRFVNAILVRRGLARSLTIPPNDRFAPLFRAARAARRAGRPRPLGRLPALTACRDVSAHSLPCKRSCALCYGPPAAPGPP